MQVQVAWLLVVGLRVVDGVDGVGSILSLTPIVESR